MTESTRTTDLELADAAAQAEFARLRRFLGYMKDYGVQSWWLAVFAKDFYGGNYTGDGKDTSAQAVFTQLYSDGVESLDPMAMLAKAFGVSGGQSDEIDLEKVAAGGASIALLVKYATLIPRHILPEDCIPSNETVARILAVFHQITRKAIESKGGQSAGSEPDVFER
jgi:hypothetical protein